MNLHYPLHDIDQAAQWLLDRVGAAKVICLHGDMGAGKTTLVQALGKQLGIAGTASSPTFPIIHEYPAGERSVFHLDLYRLQSDLEAERAGVLDVLYSGSICLVEWPDKLPAIIPPDAVHVQLEVVDAHTRVLRLLN